MKEKDDVKEILDSIKYAIDDDDWFEIEGHFLKPLLDYITDLKESDKEWHMIFDTFSSRPYAHRYLEEKRIELGNDKIVGLDSEMIYKDYYELKEQKENVIKYIKDNGILDLNGYDLLNILEGSEKE